MAKALCIASLALVLTACVDEIGVETTDVTPVPLPTTTTTTDAGLIPPAIEYAPEPPPETTTTTAVRPQRQRNAQPSSVGDGARCGGSLPTCAVMECESGGDITAENPRSSAAGKWQLLLSTSNALARRMGRSDLVGTPASWWSEAEQDEAARLLWDDGNGWQHWKACA